MNGFRMARFAVLAQSGAQGVSFGLAQPNVPITLWQGTGRNLITASGKLTLGGKPVSGAMIRLGEYTIPQPTGADGGYQFLHDQTVLDRRVLNVANAADVRIGGQPPSAADVPQLRDASGAVSTAYEIALKQTPQLARGAKDVKVSGRLTFSNKTTPVPPVVLWDYILRGVIRDGSGKPVTNALASIVSKDGETFGLSTITDETGQYLIRFYPQSDDQYEVRVGYGPDLFVSAKDITFKAAQSVEMDLVIAPPDMMLMGTGPNGALTPKEIPGAEYIGTLAGLAGAGGSIHADVSWPDADGVFTITIPAVDFAGPVAFYQAQLRFFTAEQTAPGLPVAASVVPTKLQPDMPRGLNPLTVTG